ncbi:ABC transporter ATP-binding protein [Thermomonospora catenispora]|uniref:ABC transporter ATP-binding protein n=1 Tax=Thermomonospora catenispora TaxID=2493090 RepID=UPI0011212053|nr:ABC transporter ATP-binding protein [Thermomonospora catenispora]TNY38701.1 ABC transporter ATP-binding protein [Thermomonospora catenispora]
MPPVLEARDIAKSFGPTPALRGLSLTIDAGEVVAITGPSGSGKSTLLHCLAGIIRPDAGEVRFGGTRLDRLDEEARTRLRRDNFGVVLQFGHLVPELTAAENIALPLMLAGAEREAAHTAAAEWLDRVGAGECARLRPGDLSGGQIQRVAVARALAGEPSVIFADEPTGALDTIAGEQVLAQLLGAVRSRRATLVLVTHDNQVAAYADREVIVRDGRLVDPVEPAGPAGTGGPPWGMDATLPEVTR